jgi:hypothetical protein
MSLFGTLIFWSYFAIQFYGLVLSPEYGVQVTSQYVKLSEFSPQVISTDYESFPAINIKNLMGDYPVNVNDLYYVFLNETNSFENSSGALNGNSTQFMRCTEIDD